MEQSYWQARWRKNKIGFHGAEPDAALVAHWPALGVPEGACVAVPLCGKSVDMCWLRAQGHTVYGIEFVEQACAAFFREQFPGAEPGVRSEGGTQLFTLDGLMLQTADLLRLRAGQVPAQAQVRAVYDRAALVALPPQMRQAYAAKWAELFPGAEQALLISFEYDQQLMGGPPFAVYEPELQELFGGRFRLQELSRTDMVPVSEIIRKSGFRRC
ncbi:thiopurine S-methyltransferase [Cyclonatronum proteinivorum]|uniref:thiopurine S-methyltransferase n=1 Tax=Cyclonatronum proteinivorum TaxID=1457365 RepID=A0A345UGI8_9BACT|nr:thiopurine S-methyltransferase [Cyclonatronum proteinivorum]AXI99589.1 thiopurine S-methyltransferase [Cyclonatronum proteinivorum]